MLDLDSLQNLSKIEHIKDPTGAIKQLITAINYSSSLSHSSVLPLVWMCQLKINLAEHDLLMNYLSSGKYILPSDRTLNAELIKEAVLYITNPTDCIKMNIALDAAQVSYNANEQLEAARLLRWPKITD